MKIDVFTTKGDKKGQVTLSDDIWSFGWNADLVHQVISGQASNQRANTAHTKDRGEVRGGGKKPWKQKGTGQARHGSSRSPIWRGGGVTHGPSNARNYKEVIPKKMQNRALLSLLSAKLKAGKILFVDSLATGSKTKEALEVMQGLAKVDGFKTINWAKSNNAMIFVPNKDRATHLAFRNLPNVRLENMDQLNPLTVSNTRYLVVVDAEKVSEYLAKKI